MCSIGHMVYAAAHSPDSWTDFMCSWIEILVYKRSPIFLKCIVILQSVINYEVGLFETILNIHILVGFKTGLKNIIYW